MVKTEFDYQTGILDSKFIGDVTLKEIVDYIMATKDNDSYPRTLKILTDATHATFKFLADKLPKIVEANNKSLEQYDYIIDAIVLENPKETALSILYQEMAANKKYVFQVFSTREAAKSWLESVMV